MLHEWLKTALKQANISQAELSRRLSDELGRSIDRAAVNKMTIDQRKIAADELIAIEKITGVAAPTQANSPRLVPLLGKVSAGAVMEIMSEAQGPFEEVEVPAGDTEGTAAAEIKGDCMGPLLDGWLVFWNSGRTISPKDLVGKICVIGMDDGRVMLKKLTKGSIPGMFTLLSQFDPPIYDVLVKWASPVTSMRPR